MITIKHSTVINASVEKIVAYLEDPMTILEYWPSMMDVRDIIDLPNGGKKFNLTYKMAGFKLEATTEAVEYERGKRWVYKTTGGINSLQTWSLDPEASGTRLATIMEYTIPIPLLGKLAETMVMKINEQELNTVLANIKTRVDG